MRRIAFAAATASMLAFAGMSSAQAAINVFACLPEWGALTQELGGNLVDVFTAASPHENPDNVEARPALIAKLQTADLVVCTGAGFEDGWLPAALKRANNPRVEPGKPGHFLASKYAKLLEAKEDHHNEKKGKGEKEHLHGEGNPHVQGDPRNVRTIAAQLAKRLGEVDPANAAAYGERAKAFTQRLTQLTKDLEAKAAPLKGANIAVQHVHSVYVLNWLGINTAAVVEPEPGVPPGPGHLDAVLKAVPSRKIKLVAYAAYEDPRPSQFIAERAKIALVKLPFTVGGTDGAKDYFGFYEDTVNRLLDGLAGRDRP
jgi:zinc/manganese transport system substrate-binding protein